LNLTATRDSKVCQARRAGRDVRVSKDIAVAAQAESQRHAAELSGVVRYAIDHGQTI
jgi:hypothetical protein